MAKRTKPVKKYTGSKNTAAIKAAMVVHSGK